MVSVPLRSRKTQDQSLTHTALIGHTALLWGEVKVTPVLLGKVLDKVNVAFGWSGT